MEGVKLFHTYGKLQQAWSAWQLLLSSDFMLLVGCLKKPNEQGSLQLFQHTQQDMLHQFYLSTLKYVFIVNNFIRLVTYGPAYFLKSKVL